MIVALLSSFLNNIYWLSWNVYLAFVPLALSIVLFRGRQPRSWFWWLTLLVFLAFLPNAPYLLTDVIHLSELISMTDSMWIITLVFIPAYMLFILSGFEAYVLSLINLGYYLNRIGWRRWILLTELLTHAICAVGIYLGRFLRFNSWDLMTKPLTLATRIIEVLTNKNSLEIIALTFVLGSGLYWIMKQLTLKALVQRFSFQEDIN